MGRKRLSPEALSELASAAGVELPEERLERIVPRVERLFEEISHLDEVDVSGVEPAYNLPPGQGVS